MSKLNTLAAKLWVFCKNKLYLRMLFVTFIRNKLTTKKDKYLRGVMRVYMKGCCLKLLIFYGCALVIDVVLNTLKIEHTITRIFLYQILPPILFILFSFQYWLKTLDYIKVDIAHYNKTEKI
jgi:hypothetical protein